VVNACAGNLDREGGLMFPTPALWSVTALPMPELEGGRAEFGRWSARVRGTPEVLGQVPVSCLAEEITTPGPGQVRALLTVAGNPVLSSPGAGALDEALPHLEAMVCVDNALNETTRHADVILPGLSPLEQPHLDDMIWAWAVRSAVKWSDAVFPPGGARPEEWEVLVVLAGILAGMAPTEIDVAAIDDGYFAALAEMKGVDQAVALAGSPGRGPERLADLTIRTGAFGDRYGEHPDGLTLEKVKAAPHGLDLGPMTPRLPDVLATPGRRIRLAPAHITEDLPRLRERLGRRAPALVLVSRRHLRSNNSWLHNVEVLVEGRDRCTLLMHPDDAAARGLGDGDTARVRSESGALEVAVEVTDGIRAGVVSLPHGWGHDKEGTRQSVARRHAGVNTNLLSPGRLVDVPSNNAVLNGIPVEVTAVAAAPAP
jgi:anaerobic selenocysteine-containing dehydrogenase